VTPVHDVEAYLPAFIRSIDGQRFDPARVEVVAVDDGSSDGSLDLLLDWARRSGGRVHVYTKPSAGQASARNLGLQHARGEWVTFPDPADVLDRGYLRAADRFAAANPGVELLSARPIVLDEAGGALSGAHARRWQYAHGNRAADLRDEPNVFLGVTPGSFFRLDRIQAEAIRFDERIRPTFDDTHLAVRYLLSLPRPVVGLLHDAVYVFRKRAAGRATLPGSTGDPGYYSVVPELGYLDVLERARRPDGTIPAWVQQLIVYELSWYLSQDERIPSRVRLPPELAPRFHELLDRILRCLEPDVVARHGARRLTSAWFDVLARAGRPDRWHSPTVVRARGDRAMGLRRYHYRYVGEPPAELIRTASGQTVEPAFQKTMAHRYLGRDLVWERILWLPDSDLAFELDGEEIPQGSRWDGPRPERHRAPGRTRRRIADRVALYRRQPSGRKVAGAARRLRRVLRRAAAAPARLAARSWPYRPRFADAWVLMDGVDKAGDNGERLFEHLRVERPDINAWFVVERGSPDWDRLRAAGERRLVARGSWTWKMLMLNCSWLLSSHVDLAVSRPAEILRIQPRRRWRLGFLPHGVITDDLSRPLNRRDLDLFVVSTAAELASVAGDGTPYRFTTREARNTGLPRFDRLLAVGRAVDEAQRDLVIVAPTLPQWLASPLPSGAQRPEPGAARESDDLASWMALMGSEAVRVALAKRGWRLGFMHPNLDGKPGVLDLPGQVEPLPFAGSGAQELFARCALLVTDDSPVAFDTAYLDRPVVYFQLGRTEMPGGSSGGRPGSFDYDRDGFGPVAEDLSSAERLVVAAIRHGPRPTPKYQARIDATFPVRDGGASARVVAAIEELSQPYRPTPH
jgi:glycosyltransferase involved in cell wall biosynthesis